MNPDDALGSRHCGDAPICISCTEGRVPGSPSARPFFWSMQTAKREQGRGCPQGPLLPPSEAVEQQRGVLSMAVLILTSCLSCPKPLIDMPPVIVGPDVDIRCPPIPRICPDSFLLPTPHRQLPQCCCLPLPSTPAGVCLCLPRRHQRGPASASLCRLRGRACLRALVLPVSSYLDLDRSSYLP
jgi:hypothetical protein